MYHELRKAGTRPQNGALISRPQADSDYFDSLIQSFNGTPSRPEQFMIPL